MLWKCKSNEFFAAQCCEAMALAYPERWRAFGQSQNSAALLSKSYDNKQPALIISGGAGNGPLFPAYVGEGLADAAVLGAPFAAPNAYSIYEAVLELKAKEVLLLYNNFAGDYLNNDMAMELLDMDQVKVSSIQVNDDMGSALGEGKENRSGRAAVILLIKLAKASFAEGKSLEETVRRLEHAKTRMLTLSMSVDFEGGIVRYGTGFSGEPGFETASLSTREAACTLALDRMLEELVPKRNERLFFLVNRLRLTAYADGYVMAKAAYDYLAGKHPIAKMAVGNFSNIADVYGYTFTLFAMDRQTEASMAKTLYSDSVSF